MSNTTHDLEYVKFLQQSFGTTSVPFFGSIIAIVALILICIIILLNSTTVFIMPQVINCTAPAYTPAITKPMIT